MSVSTRPNPERSSAVVEIAIRRRPFLCCFSFRAQTRLMYKSNGTKKLLMRRTRVCHKVLHGYPSAHTWRLSFSEIGNPAVRFDGFLRSRKYFSLWFGALFTYLVSEIPWYGSMRFPVDRFFCTVPFHSPCIGRPMCKTVFFLRCTV